MNFIYCLAQSASERQKELAFQRGMIWLGVLFGFVLLGGVLLLWFRAKLRKQNEESGEDLGFTLNDLKKLRDRGELSPEEFEVARNRMLVKLNARLDQRANDLKREKDRPPREAD